MTLEFDKVVPQVATMGRALAARNSTDSQRFEDVWAEFQRLTDLDIVKARIELVRERDAGYRGVAPLDGSPEALNQAYALPDGPARATIIAADGSQIYPSIHAAALYYLTNIGVLVYHDGCDDLPEPFTEPKLFYADSDLRNDGQLITNDTVNARRTLAELQTLARAAWERRTLEHELLAISDGPLMFWVRNETPNREALEQGYFEALRQLQDTDTYMQEAHAHRASLVGYVDRPTSAFVISLLHLMRLEKDEVRLGALKGNGNWDGLIDQMLMARLLQPGERSALFVQQSPQNKRYRYDWGENYEIAFFYVNVVPQGEGFHLARVEMPVWVAREPKMVDHVHALIYRQCQLMWRYPYALTRADELAVVRGHEKAELDQLIEIELRRNEQSVEHSEKLDSKTVRSGRTRYGQKARAR
ncbi:MAG TPA: DNA double-strand break repair nuclease NurA [Aggregatilinea sp.]|uniref:DNA double-strand break repair nuclease NurA n=1 Tax=Aggregatilinea sp. TaxID=2806333 RepID=UPI002C4CAB04|nr:DNA double-strand break repair nuclease NurA [Aggregatilinea sp.]HML23843.1 DNA double-strand break repair nuclease NurA [Aggregatilinea sp.]